MNHTRVFVVIILTLQLLDGGLVRYHQRIGGTSKHRGKETIPSR
jgi:hypothetical protein